MKFQPIDILALILGIGYIVIVILLLVIDRDTPLSMEVAKLLVDIIEHIPAAIGTYIGYKAGSQINNGNNKQSTR